MSVSRKRSSVMTTYLNAHNMFLHLKGTSGHAVTDICGSLWNHENNWSTSTLFCRNVLHASSGICGTSGKPKMQLLRCFPLPVVLPSSLSNYGCVELLLILFMRCSCTETATVHCFEIASSAYKAPNFASWSTHQRSIWTPILWNQSLFN